MSLGALGCNPNHRWTVTGTGANTVIGGDNPGSAAELGTIGYSNDGGLFVCVQANGAIPVNKIASIEAGWQGRVRNGGNVVEGTSLGASTAAFADNEYGWLQIWGTAQLTAGGAIAAGDALDIDGTETGDIISGTDATPEILGAVAVAAIADNAVGAVQLTFPVIRA